MKRIVAWFQGFALAIGAPGLFLVSFLDSSFLSLPEITDALLVWMVTVHPLRWVLYATMATTGSIAGCFAIYYLARKGGEAFVRRRFHERHVDRALDLFQRYGVWVLIVPAVLPPPAPFKIFVLMAGVAGMPTARFLIGVAIGRGARYFGEAVLALYYGRAAIAFLNDNLRPFAWVITATMGVAIMYGIWRWTRRAA
ncbi:MAG TPA: VTT domain-containing protein [Vicinamibacterales bacterium]|nr:VTT domain-containing protein [Vicinamibacterales bacterium]